jgi:hypothetical protein
VSQQNVEIVRRWMELANRGGVDGLAVLAAPDVACFRRDDQPESPPF